MSRFMDAVLACDCEKTWLNTGKKIDADHGGPDVSCLQCQGEWFENYPESDFNDEPNYDACSFPEFIERQNKELKELNIR